MGAIVIHGISRKNERLITELTRQLGGTISGLTKEQYEDLLLGQAMDNIKTGEEVPKATILNKLR